MVKEWMSDGWCSEVRCLQFYQFLLISLLLISLQWSFRTVTELEILELRIASQKLFVAHPFLQDLFIFENKKMSMKTLFFNLGKVRDLFYFLPLATSRTITQALSTSWSILFANLFFQKRCTNRKPQVTK